MKVFEKLKTPEDSAWDRKTWKRYVHWQIRYLIYGVRNILRWIPIMYHDRDWDDSFTLKMLQKKIEFQRKHIVSENRHTLVDYDNYWMTVTLNLIERELENYYGLEMYDYMSSDIVFLPVKGRKNTYEMTENVIEQDLENYLKKYPSSIRKVMKKNKNKDFSDKETLAFYVSNYNQKKSRNLLFEILKTKSDSWWD